MHRFAQFAVVLLAASGAAGIARAEYPLDEKSDRTRVYVGVSGSYSFMPSAAEAYTNSVVVSEVDESPGGAVLYGARMPVGIAAELALEYMNGYELRQTTALNQVTTKIRTYSVTSKLAWNPLDGWFDPFVGAGLGWMRAEAFDVSGHGFTVQAGLGANFWFGDHVGLRVEGVYTYPLNSSIENLEHVEPRVGVFYRF